MLQDQLILEATLFFAETYIWQSLDVNLPNKIQSPLYHFKKKVGTNESCLPLTDEQFTPPNVNRKLISILKLPTRRANPDHSWPSPWTHSEQSDPGSYPNSHWGLASFRRYNTLVPEVTGTGFSSTRQHQVVVFLLSARTPVHWNTTK